MQPGYRFQNLFGMINEELLKDSWRYIRKDAAFGIDRVSADEYEQNLDENIHQLVEDLKQKRYRAKLVLIDNSSKHRTNRCIAVAIQESGFESSRCQMLLKAIG